MSICTRGVGDNEFTGYVDMPEKGLVRQVLFRAIRDFLVDNGSNTRHRADAEDFIYYDGDEEWSFRWLCEQLDLEPDGLRSALGDIADGRRPALGNFYFVEL